MSAGKNYILNNFKTEHVLHSTEHSCTELVLQNGTPYIRKTINAIGLPYIQLKDVTHPCLPHIFYAIEDDGKTYIIEEYISGLSLKEALEKDHHFSFEQQKNIAKALCTALVFLHGKGILHRDIKPSNIIVMHDFQQVKLIDFGISRNFAGNENPYSQDTRIMGTPGYAPPEQYGFSTTDQRSDIYALGKTLLELKNEQSDPSYIKILERCTEFDPQKRYKSAAELLEALSKKQTNYIIPFMCCLTALFIGTGGYYFYNRSPKTIPDSAPPQTNIKNTISSNTESQQSKSAPSSQKALTPNISPQPKQVQTPPSTPPSGQNTTPPNTKAPLPQSILQQKVQLTELKQLGYDWWFDKNTLTTIDEKNNIYNFKGTDNKGPVVIVENISDYPAVNPVLKLELYTFGMKSEDFEWHTDSNHIEKLVFSRKDRLGVSRRVTIQLIGTIAPHSKYTFSGLQNVKDFYMYYKGDHGTILGKIECPNMIPKNVGYQFNLK